MTPEQPTDPLATHDRNGNPRPRTVAELNAKWGRPPDPVSGEFRRRTLVVTQAEVELRMVIELSSAPADTRSRLLQLLAHLVDVADRASETAADREAADEFRRDTMHVGNCEDEARIARRHPLERIPPRFGEDPRRLT